uniref:Uncharacterized protein n=1 Tax=Rhizophora mucronata TaxID=61149 RepID=A0A2P2PTL1_RHIMU
MSLSSWTSWKKTLD